MEIYGKKEYIKPCIEFLVSNKDYWIKEKGRFEPSEPVRITWGAMRLWRGDSIEDIIKEAESYGWVDFNPEYIQKKLEYLDSREYTPYGCSKLKEYNYCLSHIKCRYKRNDDEDLEALGIVNGRAT